MVPQIPRAHRMRTVSFLHFDVGNRYNARTFIGVRRLMWRSSPVTGSIPKPFSPR
jgi:hypothetical protein